MNNTLITYEDYSNILATYRVEYISIISCMPNELIIKYRKPKWWNLYRKLLLNECMKDVEYNKEINIKISWIECN